MSDLRKNEWIDHNTVTALFLGLQRSLGVVVEYPLECVKTRWQAQLQTDKLYKVIVDTYKLYGLRGFYHGFSPSLLRKIPAQLYRWPLLLQLPEYYKSLVTQYQKAGTVERPYFVTAASNVLTGVTVGIGETIIASPFESCKLDFIVKGKPSIIEYFKKSGISLKRHYVGAQALLLKECFGWVSFLTVCNLLRAKAKENNAGSALLMHQIIYISLLTGAANALCLMPWDVVRTQIQKQLIAQDAPSRVGSVGETLRKIVNEKGATALWRGGSIRFFQLSLATALSVPVMEEFEKRQLHALR